MDKGPGSQADQVAKRPNEPDGPSGQTGEGASSNPPAVQPRREGSASAHDIGCKGLMGSRARGATKSSSKHPTARHQGKNKKKPSSKCEPVKGRSSGYGLRSENSRRHPAKRWRVMPKAGTRTRWSEWWKSDDVQM